MIRAAQYVLITLLISTLAIPAFAQRRAELDHVGAYNFMLEIEGVNEGHVVVKPTKLQTSIACPKEERAKLIFEKALTKGQVKTLKNASYYTVNIGDEAATFSGVKVVKYFAKERTLLFTFGGCE